MSEPISKARSYPGDAELRAPRASGSPDPLAELARLVGRDDPFKDLFARKPAGAGGGLTTDPSSGPSFRDLGATRYSHPDPETRDPQGGLQVPLSSYGVDEFEPFHEPHASAGRALHDHEPSRFGDPMIPAIPEPLDPFDADEARGFGGPLAQGEAPPLNADLWAQGMPEPVSAEPLAFEPHAEDDATEADGSSKKTLLVLAAVLVLTVGGLGATFLARGGTHATSASGEPPTIMADTAPTKVQPPDTSNAATGGDGTTALLEKSASDNVGNAKVVNTQERPTDLAQLPKPQAPAASEATDDGRVGTSSNMSPFPEPKKVKTILIRPDGSVVGTAAPATEEKPVATASAAAGVPSMVDASVVPAPAQPEPVAKPATPKSTARVATTTPKSPTTPVDGVVTAKAKPAPTHTAAKPKPVETADAAPTPATSLPAETTASTAGAFAVQLAAPTTEQDAKDVMARLEKKFADDLGSHKPSIRKADKGDKTVYRVRVSNLSQDDAKALCSKLQTSGGSCFVVRN